jgi:hypothetical protein
MKRFLLPTAVIGLCLAALALTARAQTSLQVAPDQSVGVLSEDPGYGERWSTSILPFGNYTGTLSGNAVFCRTYLHFPLDGLPAGSTVQSAVLYVYTDDFWPAPGGAPMAVYPVAAAWTPGGVDWLDTAAWPALGGGVATTDVSSSGGWFTWDVTALVQGWANGAPNYGLALAAADLGSSASNWATARRLTASDPATLPYLAVVFTAPAPTATSTPAPQPTSAPQPQPTAAPQPAAPTAAPTPTPTPPPVLLPETGQSMPPVALWLLIGGGLLGLAGLLWKTRART